MPGLDSWWLSGKSWSNVTFVAWSVYLLYLTTVIEPCVSSTQSLIEFIEYSVFIYGFWRYRCQIWLDLTWLTRIAFTSFLLIILSSLTSLNIVNDGPSQVDGGELLNFTLLGALALADPLVLFDFLALVASNSIILTARYWALNNRLSPAFFTTKCFSEQISEILLSLIDDRGSESIW